MNDKEIKAMLDKCRDDHFRHPYVPKAPYCFVDSGESLPPWIQNGDGSFFWYGVKSGSSLVLEDGREIPFWTRYILCPKHKAVLEKEGVKFDG